MGDFDYDPGLTAVDIRALLEQSWENERQRLETELQELDSQVAKRDDVHDRIVEDLENKLDWYVERLDRLYHRSLGKHGGRDKLKGRIESLYEALRTERRAHWRDRQDLLVDRRRLRRELAALDDPLLAGFDLLSEY